MSRIQSNAAGESMPCSQYSFTGGEMERRVMNMNMNRNEYDNQHKNKEMNMHVKMKMKMKMKTNLNNFSPCSIVLRNLRIYRKFSFPADFHICF